MSAGAAGAFINGIFNGIETRHGWDDRKDEKARQKKLDEIAAAREARAAAQDDLSLQSQRMVLSENQRKLAEAAAQRSDASAAMAAVTAAQEQGLGAVAPSAPQADLAPLPVAPAQTTVAPEVAAIGAVLHQQGAKVPPVPPVAQSQPAQAAQRQGQAQPAPVQPLQHPVSQPEAQQADMGAVRPASPTVDPTRGQQVFVPGAGDYLLHKNGRAYDVGTGEELTDPGMLGIVKDLAVRQAAPTQPPSPGMLEPDYNRDFGQSGGAIGDVGEVAKRGLAVAGNVAGKVSQAADAVDQFALRGVDTLNRGIGAVSDYVTGYDPGFVPLARQPDTGLGAVAPPQPSPAVATPQGAAPNGAPAAMGALGGNWSNQPSGQTPATPPDQRVVQANPPANAPTAVKGIATTAEVALTDAAPADVQAAVNSAPPEVLGALQTPGVSEGAKDRATKSFMDHYREVGAPIVMKGMMERGDLQGAMAFQEFLDKDATKAGMEDWAAMAFAGVTGDFDSFADHFVSGYNRLDYFGDDTTIVKAKSGFTRDDNGTINGAILTFKNESTGATFERVFDGPDDFVEMGINFLGPEPAFQAYRDRAAAQSEAQLGAAKETAKTEVSAEADFVQRVDKLAETLFKASTEEIGGTPMTYDEARQQAIASLRGDNSLGAVAPTAAPPILYRN